MSAPAIRAERLGKQYTMATRERYQTLRDVLARAATTAFGGRRDGPVTRPRLGERLWALRELSLLVEPGEVLGVIGRNGAGKSTFLKILSRITAPSEGIATIRGRVGSLLEVGTGFHPELTGRENIYLNGAILGMRRHEIIRNFDEIVAFAETERFIDTPVKHYSSGMYMRLAFAVAAHLRTEVLLVDEVLAVGDAAFQKRCLGKMNEIAHAGRTVLFVSHNLEAVQRLCPRCVLLEGGKVAFDGPSPAAVTRYLSGIATAVRPREWLDLRAAERFGTGRARFVAVRYGSDNSAFGYQPYSRGPLEVTCLVQAEAPCEVGGFGATIVNPLGTRLVNADVGLQGQSFELPAGLSELRLTIERLYLNPGMYRVGLWLADRTNGRYSEGIYDHIESACELEVYGLESGRIELDSEAAVVCDYSVSPPVPAAWPLT